jgi:hypothetical protein
MLLLVLERHCTQPPDPHTPGQRGTEPIAICEDERVELESLTVSSAGSEWISSKLVRWQFTGQVPRFIEDESEHEHEHEHEHGSSIGSALSS